MMQIGERRGPVTPEVYARVKAVFGEALERPSEERAAFVAAACASDAALLQEVESLLAVHDGGEGFLPKPLVDLTQQGLPNYAAPLDESVPRILADRYVIEREIGRGGMGIVYLARDGLRNEAVAIKMLRADIVDSVNVARFVREARLADSCHHPRILPLLDVGEAEGRPYFVTPWIQGESLRERLARERQLPIEDAIGITSQIADALSQAHARGVLHRDVTPGNILLSDDGAFLADFGIARAIVEAEDDRLTTTGMIVGTAAYMSPEQGSGDRNLDARSDLYALASVTYEMLAGQPPFTGPTPQSVLAQKMLHAPQSVQRLRPSVPEHVDAALMRALQPVPADRFSSLEVLVDALSGARARTRRISGLTPRAIIAAAAIAVLTLGLGIVNRRSTPERLTVSGERALARWDLTIAEAELRRAVARDSTYPRAALWLAQVMMLQGAAPVTWVPLARRAMRDAAGLTARERARAAALGETSAGNTAAACPLWRILAAAEHVGSASDPTVDVGLADCLVTDSVIVADGASPSGYRFRSSYHEAETLYERALADQPETGHALAVIVPRLMRVRFLDRITLRPGWTSGRTPLRLLAIPMLSADSLGFIPWKPGELMQNDSTSATGGAEDAVARNRRLMRALCTRWAVVAPNNPEAHAALSRVLEATGELDGGTESALHQSRMARALLERAASRSSASFLERVHVASSEVGILVKAAEFTEARHLADSVLTWTIPRDADPQVRADIGEELSALPVLAGHVQLALSLARPSAASFRLALPDGRVITAPPALAAGAVEFAVYATFGAPADSLRALLVRLPGQLHALVPPSAQEQVLAPLLGRSLGMALPVVGVRAIAAVNGGYGSLGRAAQYLQRGQFVRVRALLDSVAHSRRNRAAGEITMDLVYPEAWLRAAAGDTAGAALELDNALRGLPAAAPSTFRDGTRIGALVRSMALRAELAASMGQTSTARYWAHASLELWGGGDPALSTQLIRIRQLADAAG